jgi:tetratricopeptide (TPR) repeat protein
MARDWDLVATFFIPASFLFIYLVKEYLQFPEARQIVLMIIAMQVIQTVSWIGINADETRHLQRAEILTNPSLSGTIPKVYYESLGKIFWQRKNYKRSEFWYERYLTIDSLNPRILANLADVYKKLGENEKAFKVLKRSAGASRNPVVFSNLGIEYLKRNDTILAIQMFQNALKIDSSFAYAHANLSLIYTAQHKNSLIAYHATRAITFGMTESILYRFAGNAFLALNDIEQALKYYNLYFAKKPDDANILSMIEKLQEELLRRKQSR